MRVAQAALLVLGLCCIVPAPAISQTQTVTFDELTQSARKGDSTAQYELGRAYHHGQATLQDFTLAKHWYEAAVDGGNLDAKVQLAGLYAEGLGVKQDFDTAFALYKQAAETGHVQAAHIVGTMLETGLVKGASPESAIHWYQKAARKGWTDSQAALGVIYHQGELTRQDFDLAREWYEIAATQDNPQALNNLGILYTEALGVEQDYEKAAGYYQRSADLGFSRAMTNLGVMYDNGFGVTQSDEIAIKWYKKATEQTRKSRAAIALSNAAQMNSYLESINSDLSVLKKRAFGGEKAAQYILGNLYLKGRGVPQDYVLAYQWLNLSGDNKLRDELMDRMTKDQLNEAQTRSRIWLTEQRR